MNLNFHSKFDDLLKKNSLSLFYVNGNCNLHVHDKKIEQTLDMLEGKDIRDVLNQNGLFTQNHYAHLDTLLQKEDEGVSPYLIITKSNDFISLRGLFDDKELFALHYQPYFFSALINATDIASSYNGFDLKKIKKEEKQEVDFIIN